MSEQLINKVSLSILKSNDNLVDIKKEVTEYSVLFEDTIRNAYEYLTMDTLCPLFVLVYAIEQGADNFCESDEEFSERLSELKSAFTVTFGLDYDSINTGEKE